MTKEKAIEYLMKVTEGNFTLWKYSVDTEKAIDIALAEQQKEIDEYEHFFKKMVEEGILFTLGISSFEELKSKLKRQPK